MQSQKVDSSVEVNVLPLSSPQYHLESFFIDGELTRFIDKLLGKNPAKMGESLVHMNPSMGCIVKDQQVEVSDVLLNMDIMELNLSLCW